MNHPAKTFGATLNDEQRRDLLEIAEDRHGRGSTIIVSQTPIENWHQSIGDPTLADAILDRLIHNAYKVPLKGNSVRSKYAAKPEIDSKEGDKTDQPE